MIVSFYCFYLLIHLNREAKAKAKEEGKAVKAAKAARVKGAKEKE